MTSDRQMFSRARIPYGTWGSSYFPAWQTSALAEVNIGQFAGEAMNRILSLRKVPTTVLDYLILGSTIPWHWKFWTAPMIASCVDHRIPGFHLEQACATGLQAVIVAASEVHSNANDVVGVLTFDRTSDSPVGVFPERRAHERTMALADVWDNFGFDPATGKAMLSCAGYAARKHKTDRREVDELTMYRYEQYYNAKESGLLDNVLVPLEVLNVQGKPLGTIDGDYGVRKLTYDMLKVMPELDDCVTGGTQTHASDGMATLLVTTKEKAKELSLRPEIDISFVAKTEVRTFPSLMPESPALAVQKLLKKTGLTMGDMTVVKNHNPFAVNDIYMGRLMGIDDKIFNNYGCSLVFGHPQGPTGMRCIIELIEELVLKGGGYGLFAGCAAGDTAAAVVVKVD